LKSFVDLLCVTKLRRLARPESVERKLQPTA
jgi:hypothetical protein